MRVEVEAEQSEIFAAVCENQGWRARHSDDDSRSQVDIPVHGARLALVITAKLKIWRACQREGLDVRLPLAWKLPGIGPHFDARYRIIDTDSRRSLNAQMLAPSLEHARLLLEARQPDLSDRKIHVKRLHGEPSDELLSRREQLARSQRPPRGGWAAFGVIFSLILALAIAGFSAALWPLSFPWACAALAGLVGTTLLAKHYLGATPAILFILFLTFMAFIMRLGPNLEWQDAPLWLGGAIALAFTVPGVFHYLTHTPQLRKNASWLLPALVPLLLPLPLVFGDFAYATYLNSFGLKASTVSLPWWQTAWPALGPLGIAILAITFIVACFGWFYRLFALPPIMAPLWIATTVIAILIIYLLWAASSLVTEAHAAGQRSVAELTRAGRTTSFYGVNPTAMCVTPTTDVPATIGAPLPTNRPIIFFGEAGDRAALWDRLNGSLTVKRDDVRLTYARSWERC
ncbi:hypothetical protein [Nonomuraea sp. 10N515B]|uniref:hypothetical protein n=1 Tax=Nonomuraea sp. 10N515B TaxID=3457422 RepID=UPI003FCC4C0E